MDIKREWDKSAGFTVSNVGGCNKKMTIKIITIKELSLRKLDQSIIIMHQNKYNRSELNLETRPLQRNHMKPDPFILAPTQSHLPANTHRTWSLTHFFRPRQHQQSIHIFINALPMDAVTSCCSGWPICLLQLDSLMATSKQTRIKATVK